MSSPHPSLLSIGELARRAGLAPSAIRYYERIGLLAEPERASGRRRYEPSVLERLALIDTAQRAGFTLAETRTLLSGLSRETPHPQVWRELAVAKLVEVDALAARAAEMRRLLELGLECECRHLGECKLLDESRGQANAPDVHSRGRPG